MKGFEIEEQKDQSQAMMIVIVLIGQLVEHWLHHYQVGLWLKHVILFDTLIELELLKVWSNLGLMFKIDRKYWCEFYKYFLNTNDNNVINVVVIARSSCGQMFNKVANKQQSGLALNNILLTITPLMMMMMMIGCQQMIDDSN